MHGVLRVGLVAFLLCVATPFLEARAQSPAATAALREIHAEGLKTLSEAQVAALGGLQTGSQIGRDGLQAAADKLVQSGMFAHVKYNFQSRSDGLSVTFRLEEAPRIPAYFDNLPWFSDSELNDAIRKRLPFYNGELPANGSVIEEAGAAIHDFLAAHGLEAAVEHQVLANPVNDGNVQDFHIEGASLRIASVEFSDPALNKSNLVQQQLSELKGKPYSRMTIDLFLAEQVRPVYLQQGFLRAKLGPAEVRLTGNPNQKLPEQIPVFIPVSPGAVYHWKGAEFAGNSLLSSLTLGGDIGLKPGAIADGMTLQAGWDRIREEYAHRGYLDAKVDPVVTYDDQAHTVSYAVSVNEGKSYTFGSMVLTGLSNTAEKRLRDAWPIPQGEVFDKAKYEDFLAKLETSPSQVFGDLPIHYDSVGHYLQPDAAKSTVEVLLDFK